MPGERQPLLTQDVHERLAVASRTGAPSIDCTLDLGRSTTTVEVADTHWTWHGQRFPYLDRCRDRTVYHWTGDAFAPVARFGRSLIKLVPTEWGAPTFEIDGVKMLPTAQGSPFDDARRKVEMIRPAGKAVLDTCAGLGYFAHWCLAGGARQVVSFEKNEDVLWIRALNPWSPGPDARLQLVEGDVAEQIESMPNASFDAILHDPPRFALAGELYSADFYRQLARVIRPGGLLFHYTGTPNKLTTGRDVPVEIATRLKRAGFDTRLAADGVFGRRVS